MKLSKHFLYFLFLLTALACNSQGEKAPVVEQRQRLALADSIEVVTQQLLQQNEDQLDRPTAIQLIDWSRHFAEAYPADSLAPVLLFRAADVARGIGQYGEAVALWGQVSQAYPKHPKAENALFLQGFTTDQHLNTPEVAVGFYQQFLARYPNSAIAGDVQVLLQLLENQKSPEELIKEFEKNKER